MVDSQSKERLTQKLKALTLFANKPVELHDSLPSTSTLLAELAKDGAPEGTLVIARRQSKGRGRMGNSFTSPEGGLYVSLLLRRKEDFEDAPTSLLAGLAVSRAIDEVARVATYLEYPNDILLEQKKVAGILVEASQDAHGPRLIVGIGVNVNVPMKSIPFLLRSRMTSILLETGQEFDLDDLLVALLSWFEGHLQIRQDGKGSLLIGQISDRMPMIGRTVRAKIGRESVQGTALALTSSGALILETKSGRKRVNAGEIREVRGL